MSDASPPFAAVLDGYVEKNMQMLERLANVAKCMHGSIFCTEQTEKELRESIARCVKNVHNALPHYADCMHYEFPAFTETYTQQAPQQPPANDADSVVEPEPVTSSEAEQPDPHQFDEQYYVKLQVRDQEQKRLMREMVLEGYDPEFELNHAKMEEAFQQLHPQFAKLEDRERLRKKRFTPWIEAQLASSQGPSYDKHGLFEIAISPDVSANMARLGAFKAVVYLGKAVYGTGRTLHQRILSIFQAYTSPLNRETNILNFGQLKWNIWCRIMTFDDVEDGSEERAQLDLSFMYHHLRTTYDYSACASDSVHPEYSGSRTLEQTWITMPSENGFGRALLKDLCNPPVDPAVKEKQRQEEERQLTEAREKVAKMEIQEAEAAKEIERSFAAFADEMLDPFVAAYRARHPVLDDLLTGKRELRNKNNTKRIEPLPTSFYPAGTPRHQMAMAVLFMVFEQKMAMTTSTNIATELGVNTRLVKSFLDVMIAAALSSNDADDTVHNRELGYLRDEIEFVLEEEKEYTRKRRLSGDSDQEATSAHGIVIEDVSDD